MPTAFLHRAAQQNLVLHKDETNRATSPSPVCSKNLTNHLLPQIQ